MEKSFAKFPSDAYAQIISLDLEISENSEINFETIKESVSSLKISYKDIEYTIIGEQASITLIDLIANIGGTLGLFIGISLLSFVEIAEILIKLANIMLKERMKQKSDAFNIKI